MSRQQYTQTGEVLTIADAAARPPISLTVYGKSIQDGTPTPSSPVAITSTASPSLVMTPCNFLDLSAATDRTVHDVTMTSNGDGTFTFSGTASATSDVSILTSAEGFARPPAGVYVLSGITGGSSSTYRMTARVRKADGTTAAYVNVATDPVEYTFNDGYYIDSLYVNVKNGVATNFTASPMLVRKADAGAAFSAFGTATALDLNGHELRSLPDGTQDELAIDSDGNATLTKRVGYVDAATIAAAAGTPVAMTNYVRIPCIALEDASPPNNITNGYCNVAEFIAGSGYSSDTLHVYTHNDRVYLYAPIGDKSTWSKTTAAEWITEHDVEVTYPLATAQTIDLGTISLPDMADGLAYISAAAAPTITLAYWAWALELIYDGHYIADLFSVERHVKRSLDAWEPNLVDVSGRNGQLFAGTRTLPTQLTFDLYAIDGTREERQAAFRTLAAWLAVDEPKKLALGDEDGLYRMAIPSGESVQEAYLNADHAEVTFVCPDPVLYGETKSKSVTGSTSVTVGGTAKTAPRITGTIKGSGGSWRLVDETGAGIYVAVDTSSHALVIDCEARTITVDGATVMLPPTYDWLSWEPGTHTLTKTGGTTSLTIEWDERWW